MEHNGFKIIGIVPLKDCNQKFRKNLKIGIPYIFYNNYGIYVKDDLSAIESVKKYQSKVPTTLYNLENGIKVNVSAVVGENGSGKSAIIELFYYLIYAVSIQKKYTEIGLTKYSEILRGNLEQLTDDIQSCKTKNNSVYDFGKKLQKKFNLKFKDKETGIIYLKTLKKKLWENKFSNLLEASTDVIKTDLRQLEDDILSCDEKQADIYSFCINLQKKYDFHVEFKNENLDHLQSVEKELEEKKILLERLLEDSEYIDKLISQQLNVALIYEIESIIYILEYSENKLVIKDVEGQKIADQYIFNNFFYSISLNYSHHSLNSKVLGGWLDSLFHKNDGYKTPVVINPMRNDGIYDINHELKLSKERLMFNLAYYLVKSQNNNKGKDSKIEYKLLNKYRIKLIKFSIKQFIYPVVLKFEQKGLKEYDSFFLIEDFINKLNATEVSHLDIAISYLDGKLEKIKKNYRDIIYKDFDKKKDDEKLFFETFIKNDSSHISKKIKQVVNYLRYSAENIPLSDTSNSIFKLKVLESNSFTSEEFVSYILENKNLDVREKSNSINVLDLINYLPPAIFNIDFELSLDNNDSILLSQLSSGEQQMIFNINTILYHLYNLQSSFSSNNTRLVYKSVSIILDEIELYYHPDMQREILKEILDSLELIKDKETLGIQSINLCFLTHSPFILSDIPSQNILRLKKEINRPKDETNSFAANIYDLLNDDFFLEKGAIGAFASHKITNILEKKNIEQEDMEIVNLIGDPFLKGVIKKKIEDKLSSSLLQKEIERLQKILKNQS